MIFSRIRPLWVLSIFSFLLFPACSGSTSSTTTDDENCCTSEGNVDVDTISDAAIRTITTEVDYMTGAEPYTGTASDGEPLWNFLRSNMEALVNQTKTIEVPTTLEEMENVDITEEGPYSSDEILSFADSFRDRALTDGETLNLYILFLDGCFERDGSEDCGVLGVSLGDTGVIAIFKEAIESNSFRIQRIRNFTEQTVVIHEVGHALGLVNNGLPLQSDHHDEEHGAHCTNDACVMYYLNEGASDLIDFMVRKDPSTESVVFEDACLADARAQLASEPE